MIAIIGLGMVGNELYNYFDNSIVLTKSKRGKNIINVDITDKDSIMKILQYIKPEVVINTAAMTNVDLCETKRELAYKINAIGARNIGEACKKIGCKLIHISTDYIFDGEKGNYKEDDIPNPINYYGYSKLEGEKLLLDLEYDNILIVRISVPYCLSTIKDNFFTWVYKKLNNNEPINVISDQWITPTYIKELCIIMDKLINTDFSGILHVGGKERVSRYEFALKVADIFELNKNLINPIKMDEINWKAKRPKDSSLNSRKVEKLLNIELSSIDKCLYDIKKEYFNKNYNKK